MAQYSENWETSGAGVPTGWTERWDTGNRTYNVNTNNQLNVVLSTGTARSLISLDAANNQDDVDILVSFSHVTRFMNSSTQFIGVAARCSGTGSTETGYVCHIRENGNLEILKYDGSTPGSIATTSLTSALGLSSVLEVSNRLLSLRFQCVGTALRAKIWFTLEEDEPASWDIDTTDSAITTGDWCGIWSFLTSSAVSYNFESFHVSDVPGSAVASFNTVSGNISDENGSAAERDVILMHRATQRNTRKVTSNSGTGAYEIKTPFGGEHSIIVLDDANTAPLLNDLINRVVPQ